jgi:HAD superfamily hydrolase (TIGR01509 family)
LLGDEADEKLVEEISRRKESLFRRLANGNTPLLPGARALLANLHQAGIRQALATSAPLENIQAQLGDPEVMDFFQAVVSGSKADFPGKPHPGIFLEAARQLGTDPRFCLVIEDAIAGVKAAKAAGMYCLAVTNTNPRADLALADRVVDSLEEVEYPELVG